MKRDGDKARQQCDEESWFYSIWYIGKFLNSFKLINIDAKTFFETSFVFVQISPDWKDKSSIVFSHVSSTGQSFDQSRSIG